MKAIFGVADTVFSSYMCIWVFVAKYRRRVFDACAIDVLRGIFAEVCSDAQTTLVEMDGEDDHVHVEYPPKLAYFLAREQPEECFQSLAAPAAP